MSMFNNNGVRRCVVIVGPQGSGKTTLAEAIAKNHGSFCISDGMPGGFDIGNMMTNNPDTIIVDEVLSFKRWLSQATRLAISSSLQVSRKGKADTTITNNPNWIFCTGDKNALKIDKAGRRFLIIEIKG